MAKKKRRKLTKAQAKEQALRQRRQRQIILALAGVGVVAVVVVLALVAAGGGGGTVTDVEPLREDIETGITAEGYPFRGAADAPVTIIEFSDYNCPHCGDFALEVVPLIDETFVATGEVKYVLHPFALWSESVPIVEASLCALEQDDFWEFHHLLFANRGRFSRQRPPSRGLLQELAEASGLENVDVFLTCVDEGREQQAALDFTRNAIEEWGVNSTPSIFINGERVAPAFDAISTAIQKVQATGTGE